MGLGKTLPEIENMSPEELTGWMAYYQLEPWGCLVEDHRVANHMDLVFALATKKGTKIPRWFDRDPQGKALATPTQEELEENIRDFFIGKTIVADPDAEPDEEPVLVKPTKKTRKSRKPSKPAK